MASSRICSISDCGKPLKYPSKGWCNMHYQRWRAYGDPFSPVKKVAKTGEPLRFLREIVLAYDKDDCLIWPYARHGFGYGVVQYNGTIQLVHRIACEYLNGTAPDGDVVAAHNCGNGSNGCVNPHHLRWATRSENQRDMLEHGTSNRGERCPTGKLTEDDVREIRRLRGSKPYRAIAEQFGITRGHVKGIYYGRVWGWLDQ